MEALQGRMLIGATNTFMDIVQQLTATLFRVKMNVVSIRSAPGTTMNATILILSLPKVVEAEAGILPLPTMVTVVTVVTDYNFQIFKQKTNFNVSTQHSSLKLLVCPRSVLPSPVFRGHLLSRSATAWAGQAWIHWKS